RSPAHSFNLISQVPLAANRWNRMAYLRAEPSVSYAHTRVVALAVLMTGDNFGPNSPGKPLGPSECPPDADTMAHQNLTVNQLIDLLAKALDRELQVLEQGGAAAVKTENLAAAVTNIQQ